MKSIKEKADEKYPAITGELQTYNKKFIEGANYVLNEIEKELQRRMLEDYNQGAEEDEIAQGCMASMIMFVRQLKK